MSTGSFNTAIRAFCLLAILIIFSGCSAESWKRTAYETAQNIKQQQCAKELRSECSQRDSYEEYQRKREASVETE